VAVPDELLKLAHVLGDRSNDLCIEAEGNVSCNNQDGTIWIKASGARLEGIGPDGFVRVNTRTLLSALESPTGSVEEVRRTLNDSVSAGSSGVPSTESYMHAAILSLTGERFVAHSHPVALLSLLTTVDAEYFSRHRLFPDEIVMCGPAACFVPYFAPGLPLAKEIVTRLKSFRDRHGIWPRTVWLQNHGLIAIGSSASEAAGASLMSEKAARVLLGALQTNQEIKWLTQAEVDTIYSWPDEHFRQKRLRGE
jgi:rhamnose utilization protein RhaD (predicted bifunctional aldolase and dehydrogenase)